MGTPSRVVTAITIECELREPHPLQLDPFVMADGMLQWEGTFPADPIDDF